jgi:formamidopyrimidine-DNA glycosylase
MPELPEVETVCRGLEKVLAGRKIAAIETRRQGLRHPFPAGLGRLAGARITAVRRRAKYILLPLDDGKTLVLHLGMSGRLLVRPKGEDFAPEKHDHMLMTMADGTKVVFNDARRFGIVELLDGDIARHRLFSHLGPEPLEKDFSAAYLAEKLKGKKVAIKLALMDQRLVVGVGNIYASEALFRAGISPKRRAGSVKKAEAGNLVKAVRQVLQDAIKAGGSSLKDYVQTDGELGYFQHRWAVYDKAGKKCPGCFCDPAKTGGIQKFTQGGRSTFYCPRQQK